jgi:signal transduction histidine kinase
MKCTLSLPDGDLAIEAEAATALFRILQEALTNIARHSEAAEFSVRLAEEGGLLRLEVLDNGRGFQERQPASGGSLGILGMKERAFLLGGRLTIGNAPGKGASVTAVIPRRRTTGSSD